MEGNTVQWERPWNESQEMWVLIPALPAPSQLCDLGEITLPLHLRSWPENEEFVVMI